MSFQPPNGGGGFKAPTFKPIAAPQFQPIGGQPGAAPQFKPIGAQPGMNPTFQQPRAPTFSPIGQAPTFNSPAQGQLQQQQGQPPSSQQQQSPMQPGVPNGGMPMRAPSFAPKAPTFQPIGPSSGVGAPSQFQPIGGQPSQPGAPQPAGQFNKAPTFNNNMPQQQQQPIAAPAPNNNNNMQPGAPRPGGFAPAAPGGFTPAPIGNPSSMSSTAGVPKFAAPTFKPMGQPSGGQPPIGGGMAPRPGMPQGPNNNFAPQGQQQPQQPQQPMNQNLPPQQVNNNPVPPAGKKPITGGFIPGQAMPPQQQPQQVPPPQQQQQNLPPQQMPPVMNNQMPPMMQQPQQQQNLPPQMQQQQPPQRAGPPHPQDMINNPHKPPMMGGPAGGPIMHHQGQQQQNLEPLIPPHITPPSKHHIAACCDVFPSSVTLHNRCGIPQGVIITPFADANPTEYDIDGKPIPPIPVLDFGGLIVRCAECRAYLNPFSKFVDRGTIWICNFCGVRNPTPDQYYRPLDPSTGYRIGLDEQKELTQSVYEMVAPSDYNTRSPVPPTFIFILNVSTAALQTGYLNAFAATLKACLPHLIESTTQPMPNTPQQQLQQHQNGQQQQQQQQNPPKSRGRIAFLTYDQDYHFYEFKKGHLYPQMHVGCANTPIQLPTSKQNLHCNIQDNFDALNLFLDNLPQMFEVNPYDTHQGDACTATVLEACHAILDDIGGRIFLFSSQLPNVGPGKLPNRCDSLVQRMGQPTHAPEIVDSLISKDKNGSTFYDQLSFKFSRTHFSVDLFVLTPPVNIPQQQQSATNPVLGPNGQPIPQQMLEPPQGAPFNNPQNLLQIYKATPSVDLATLSDLSRLTSGELYYYPHYNDLQYEAFSQDLKKAVSATVAWEAVYRLRTSPGAVISDVYGNFSIRGNSLIMLPTVDARKTLTFEFRPSDAPTANTPRCIFLQGALLYTTAWGERRIRVISHCIPTSQSQHEIYEKADPISIGALLAKQSIGLALPAGAGLGKGRQHMLHRVITILKGYRATNNTSNVPTFEFPPHMELLKLLALGFSKSLPMRDANDVYIDNRVYLLYKMLSLNGKQISQFFKPTLYDLTPVTEGFNDKVQHDALLLPHADTNNNNTQNNRLRHIVTPNGQLTLSTLVNPPLMLPQELPLTQGVIQNDGIYLLNNGVSIFIIIGSGYEQTHGNVLGKLLGCHQTTGQAVLLPAPIDQPLNNNNSILYKYYSLIHHLQSNITTTGAVTTQNVIVVLQSQCQQFPVELQSAFVLDPQAGALSAQSFMALLNQ